MVFKPSEQTPLTALKMAEILAEELPPGVVNIVTGRGETRRQLRWSTIRGVDMISLTGDVGTGQEDASGRRQARSSARTWNSAARPRSIVFDDADIAEVVEGLRAFGYYNAGQDCTAACRIYAARRRSMSGWSPT